MLFKYLPTQCVTPSPKNKKFFSHLFCDTQCGLSHAISHAEKNKFIFRTFSPHDTDRCVLGVHRGSAPCGHHFTNHRSTATSQITTASVRPDHSGMLNPNSWREATGGGGRVARTWPRRIGGGVGLMSQRLQVSSCQLSARQKVRIPRI